jgi:hypothetical protein
MGEMTVPPSEPGDRRPLLDHAPGERYRTREPGPAETGPVDALAVPAAIVLGTAVAFTVLGGLLAVTAGLIVVAALAGWLIGRFLSPPSRAAVVAVVAVVLGFLAIWVFGRIEGGVLDPIDYLLEVEGPIVVGLSVLAGGGLAAAASR